MEITLRTDQALSAVAVSVWVPFFSLLPQCQAASLGGSFLEHWSVSPVVSLLNVAVSGALIVDGTVSAGMLVYISAFAGISAYAGEWLGFQTWGCGMDPIGRSWAAYAFCVGAILVAVSEFLGAGLLRRLMPRVPKHLRWGCLVVCCAYGPLMLALTRKT